MKESKNSEVHIEGQMEQAHEAPELSTIEYDHTNKKLVASESVQTKKQKIRALEDRIEAIQLADAKVEDGRLRGIKKEAIADDISAAGLSIAEHKDKLQQLKAELKSSNKNWIQRAAVIGGVALLSMFAPKEVKGQQTLESHATQEKTIGAKEYNPAFYTPGSPEYNPLKVFQDFSFEFHPDAIDSIAVGMGGGAPHPLRIEMDKLNHLSSLQEELLPDRYQDVESFTAAFIKNREAYFSHSAVLQMGHLHDAYYKGKSMFYRTLLDTYKDNFEAFRHDQPKEAQYDFNDFDAGLMYNRSKDVDYNNEKAFAEVIEDWTNQAHEDVERVWDFDYQKDHLKEEALARWNSYQETK